MALWLKDTFLDAIGFGFTPPPPSSRRKRRATSDGRRRSKAQRYSPSAYRSAPYGSSPGPSSAGYRREGKLDKETPSRIVPTATKLVAYSDDDESASSTGSELPAGFVDDDEAFRSVVPREDSDAFEGVQRNDFLMTPPPPSARESKSSSRVPPVRKVTSAPANTSVEDIVQAIASPKKKSITQKKEQDPWLTHPNTLARDIVAATQSELVIGDAASAIQAAVAEPEYTLRDIEIRDQISHLRVLMHSFAKHFFSFALPPDTTLTNHFFSTFAPETAKIIGCVASGGPGGEDGWKEMFSEAKKRRALVCAIVGNVVVEQVWQHLFFGGITKHVKSVAGLQERFKDEDGFDRNAHYATYIRSILDTHDTRSINLPSNFTNHVSYIVGVLYTHLAPILALNRTFETRSMIPGLLEIVTHAGILSLAMRMDPHTVYHFEPVFKEDTFSSKRMECFNKKHMEQTNPRTDDEHELLKESEKERRAGLSSAEKKRRMNDEPLTQITVMDGVTAYRRGGWESPESKTLNVQFEKVEWANQGVRARILTPGWVLCRWGRAREFKDGKSADIPRAHGVAWNGGFKEFADVKGVVDWIGIERVEREKKREAMLATLKAKGQATVKSRPGAGLSTTAKGKGRLSEADLQAQLEEDSSV